jgi:hypothetical protein
VSRLSNTSTSHVSKSQESKRNRIVCGFHNQTASKHEINKQ